MIETLAALPDTARLEADICIVGGGAAGIALAHELRGAGLTILLAESGGETDSGEARSFNIVEEAGHPFPGAVEGRARRLGGATTLWAGQSLPLDPIDFDSRPWVPHSGWPIGHDTLAPYWARAERFLKLAGMRYDEAAWRHLGAEPPAFDPEALRPQVSRLSRNRNFARLYRDDLARAADVRVLLDATTVAIVPPAGDRGRYRIRLRTRAGRDATAEAGTVVVCCGGLDTPRLLLASTEGAPAGLGNERDLVGRFLMDHPTAYCAEVLDPDFDRLVHHFRPFYRREGRLFPKIALAEAVQRRVGVLNATSELVFTAPADAAFATAKAFYGSLKGGDPVAAALRAMKVAGRLDEVARFAWTRAVKRRLPAAKGSRIQVWAHIEQEPDPESRVTLSAERDALGMPRARLDWRLGELDRRTFRVFAETVGAEFARLGLGRVAPAPWLDDEAGWRDAVQDFYHHIGTARMADDPSRGVVDADLQVHGHPGLHVASSAVFPTGGASNPTLTILALTLRLADRIKARAG
ncbi:MAG: GMC family oxidoreductase [Azospirillaceae bacterium]